MQTKTSQRESLFSRIVALFVAFVLATSFVNLGAIVPAKAWADGTSATVSASDCQLIGDCDGDPVYYGELPEGTTVIVFDVLTSSTDGTMIAAVASNAYVEGVDRVSGIGPYASSRDVIEDEFDLDGDAVKDINLDAEDLYAFWVVDAGSEMYYFVLKIPAASEPEPYVAPQFSVSVDGVSVEQSAIVKTEGGYTGVGNFYLPEATVDLYTVSVPKGAVEFDIAFDKACLAYSYARNNDSESFIKPIYPGEIAYGGPGITSYKAAIDEDKDGNPDFVQVQKIFTATYGEGELLYAITFKYEEPADEGGKGDDEGGKNDDVTPSPVTQAVSAAELNASLNSVYREVFTGIQSGLKDVGGYGESGAQQYLEIAAAAVGSASAISQAAVLANAENAVTKYEGSIPLAVLQLVAAGIDPTKVTLSDGSTVNMIDRLAEMDASAQYSTVLGYGLLAYASGPYSVDATKKGSAINMLKSLASQQSSDGSWDGAWGPDVTAMIIPALAAYSENETSAAMLSKALDYLKSQQKADGSFGNADSTGMSMIALCSVGIDPSKGDNSALKALLSQAASTKDAFLYEGEKSPLATAQGFLALAAYQGMVNTGKAYNVFTQAKLAQAKLPEVSPVPEIKIETAGTDIKISDVTGLDKVLAGVQADPEFAGETIKSIELKFSADPSQDDIDAIRKAAGEIDGLALFDASLLVNTDKREGVDIGDKAYALVSFKYAFGFTGKENVKVFRVHKGVVTELTETVNDKGEGVVFDKENGTITIMSTQFSGFGIAYNTTTSQGSGSDTTAKTSDPMDVAPLAALALGSVVTLCVATRRMNGSRD